MSSLSSAEITGGTCGNGITCVVENMFFYSFDIGGGIQSTSVRRSDPVPHTPNKSHSSDQKPEERGRERERHRKREKGRQAGREGHTHRSRKKEEVGRERMT
jgi:hypothetical protein